MLPAPAPEEEDEPDALRRKMQKLERRLEMLETVALRG